VQGAAAALTIPGSLALLTAATGEERRGRAIGAWSAWSVVATALGPVLGGLLAGQGWWRAVFFLNLPLAVAALGVLRGVPESRDEWAPERLDFPGALLAAIGLAGITAGCLLAPEQGAGDPRVLAALGIGAAALVLFAVVEARSPHPLLPLSLFRSRSLSVGVILTLLVHSAFHGLLLFLPLHLIQAQGYGASVAGLTQLPVMLLLVALSRWAGGLVDRNGPRLPLTWGPGLAALGFLLLSRPGLTAGPSEFWTAWLPPLLVVGTGMALTLSPLSTTVISSVPTGRSGLASGINSTASRLAGVLAVAILGAVALSTFGHALELRARNLDLSDSAREALTAQATKLGAARAPEGAVQAQQAIREALTDTFRHVCRLAALLCGAGALLAAVALPSRQPTIEERRSKP
jgi:predicted MFS family arabinose efflux permease